MSRNLLSVSADAKTIKGEKFGYLTGILYLAPHDISGYQVCPKATPGCIAACLYSAGRGAYTNVQKARIRKTIEFFKNREQFMSDLVKDIEKLERKAKREGLNPVVRLNGTSDLPFEKFKCVRDGKEYSNLMTAFPNVNFMDYTAILGRKAALSLPNYHLTFSLKESNDKDAAKALKEGYNIAVVMKVKKNEPKPEFWNKIPVVDGDESDLRFLDPKGNHVVALTAKGKARYDKSGFVRDVNGTLN